MGPTPDFWQTPKRQTERARLASDFFQHHVIDTSHPCTAKLPTQWQNNLISSDADAISIAKGCVLLSRCNCFFIHQIISVAISSIHSGSSSIKATQGASFDSIDFDLQLSFQNRKATIMLQFATPATRNIGNAILRRQRITTTCTPIAIRSLASLAQEEPQHCQHSLLILGKPGGGKGTISGKILNDFPQFRHVSTGDELRQHVRNGTELGKEAKKYMDGKLLLCAFDVYE